MDNTGSKTLIATPRTQLRRRVAFRRGSEAGGPNTSSCVCRALGRGALYWKKNRTFSVFTPHDPMKKTVTRCNIIRPNLILSLRDLHNYRFPQNGAVSTGRCNTI